VRSGSATVRSSTFFSYIKANSNLSHQYLLYLPAGTTDEEDLEKKVEEKSKKESKKNIEEEEPEDIPF